jgi:3-phosphoglycerate kinase
MMVQSVGDKLFIDSPNFTWTARKVLMRVDFNVPLKDGHVQDNQRIVATIPTIQFLLDRGIHSLVLMSHLGRPDGKVCPELSLKPVAVELETILSRKVVFIEDIYADVPLSRGISSFVRLRRRLHSTAREFEISY